MENKNETMIEISYNKKFNLGNYNHKEYLIKLSGNEEQITEQFEQRREKLQSYLEQLETIVDLAHEANLLKDKLAKEIPQESPKAS